MHQFIRTFPRQRTSQAAGQGRAVASSDVIAARA